MSNTLLYDTLRTIRYKVVLLSLLSFLTCNLAWAQQTTTPHTLVFEGSRHVYAGYSVYLRFVSKSAAQTTHLFFDRSPMPSGFTYEFLCDRGRPCGVYQDGRQYRWQHLTTPQLVLIKITTNPYVAQGEYTLPIMTEMNGVKVTTPLKIQVEAAPFPQVRPSSLSPVAIPGTAKWESTMLELGEKWCKPAQRHAPYGDESAVWYYDGARVYFQLADYTGDKKWEACAFALAEEYRDHMNKLSTMWAWRANPRGLLMAYERTGDVRYRQALDNLTKYTAHSDTGGSIEFSQVRETAFNLHNYIAAEKAGLPRHPLMTRAVDYLIGNFVTLFRPGLSFRPSGIHQIFMDGLGAAALIEYYELTGDPRVPPAIKSMLDWVWNNAWNDSTKKLVVNPAPAGPNCTYGCQQYETSLINLTAPAYAWYWQLTGDYDYQRKGDEMFAHALDSDISWNGKIFSQNYRWSFDYVKWRSGIFVWPTLKSVQREQLATVGTGSANNSELSIRITLDRPAPLQGATVYLQSSNPSLANMPKSVYITPGQISALFTLTSIAVVEDKTLTITASFRGKTIQSQYTLRATTLSCNVSAGLTGLAVYPQQMKANTTAGLVNTITFNSPFLTEGPRVLLQSSNPAVLSVPAVVTGKPGNHKINFAMTSHKVTAKTNVTVTATYCGQSKTAVVTILP